MVTLERVLAALETAGSRVDRRSRWYRSAPVPPSDQPDYINGVAALASALEPAALMGLLHDIERRFGRTRRRRWEARVVDLDLLAHGDLVIEPGDGPAGLVLPHPRLHLRAFVLQPLAEIFPEWRHPKLKSTAAELLAALPPDQGIEVLEATGGRESA